MSDNHCHSHQDSCCGAQQCHCCCHSHEHHHEETDFAHELLEMADEAWMDVLRDKIKEKILASSGARLDQIAALVAETNNNRWKNKMASHRSCDDYEDKLDDLLNK